MATFKFRYYRQVSEVHEFTVEAANIMAATVMVERMDQDGDLPENVVDSGIIEQSDPFAVSGD